MTKYYHISSLCRDDILEAFKGHEREKEVKKELKKLTDVNLEYLAKKMSDDYCNQLYWNSLKYIFISRFLD